MERELPFRRDPMSRSRLVIVLCALGLSLVTVAPVAAADPTVIDFDDPALEAADSASFTTQCGVPIAVDYAGHIVFHLRASGPWFEIDAFQTMGTYTNLLTGSSVSFHDAGPIRHSLSDDGHVIIDVTGRHHSSRWVGRITLDLSTPTVDVVAMHGHPLVDVFGNVCELLTD
jgi:hypothetical protein